MNQNYHIKTIMIAYSSALYGKIIVEYVYKLTLW